VHHLCGILPSMPPSPRSIIPPLVTIPAVHTYLLDVHQGCTQCSSRACADDNHWAQTLGIPVTAAATIDAADREKVCKLAKTATLRWCDDTAKTACPLGSGCSWNTYTQADKKLKLLSTDPDNRVACAAQYASGWTEVQSRWITDGLAEG
jgi:hypothetical protein